MRRDIVRVKFVVSAETLSVATIRARVVFRNALKKSQFE